MKKRQEGLTYLSPWEINGQKFELRGTITKEELMPLAASLKAKGMIQPIVVRKIDDRYQVVAGYRRLLAARDAGMKEIPCRILDLDDIDTLFTSLLENIDREDLNPLVEAAAFKAAVEELGLTVEEISKRTGKRPDFIRRRLDLFKLPDELLTEVAAGNLGISLAAELLKLEDPKDRLLLGSDFAKTRCGYERGKAIIEHFLVFKEKMKERPEKALEEARVIASKGTCTWCHELEERDRLVAQIFCEGCFRKITALWTLYHNKLFEKREHVEGEEEGREVR